jgi:hypothetical protein
LKARGALAACALALGLVLSLAAPSSALTLPAGEIGGTVTYHDGSAAPGVSADLFTAKLSGGREHFLTSAETDLAGRHRFTVDDGCYVIVLSSPAGDEFVGGGHVRQQDVCVSGGNAGHTVDAVLKRSVSSVGGSVTTTAGEPAGQVIVDVFDATATGGRAGFVSSTETDASGDYTVGLGAPGCYLLVFSAPPGGTLAGGAQYEQATFCVGEGDAVSDLGAVVASTGQVRLGGQVSFESGAGAAGVAVDLHAAAGDGSRGAFLASTTSDSGGGYRFDVAAACYAVVLTAPDGGAFVGGGATVQRKVCAGRDQRQVIASIDATLAGSAAPPTALSAIELELVRLTNELRAEPAGPLARRRQMPPCVEDSFYGISIDPATGHPEPSPPLSVDERVTVEMARAWAVEMQQRRGFSHRLSPSQQDVYDRLGIAVEAWGENIAWLAGFRPEETARIHFEGWRESDTGHYCTMMSARFAYVGVGEHRQGDESWAVQNFYQPR